MDENEYLNKWKLEKVISQLDMFNLVKENTGRKGTLTYVLGKYKIDGIW